MGAKNDHALVVKKLVNFRAPVNCVEEVCMFIANYPHNGSVVCVLRINKHTNWDRHKQCALYKTCWQPNEHSYAKCSNQDIGSF